MCTKLLLLQYCVRFEIPAFSLGRILEVVPLVRWAVVLYERVVDHLAHAEAEDKEDDQKYEQRNQENGDPPTFTSEVS